MIAPVTRASAQRQVVDGLSGDRARSHIVLVPPLCGSQGLAREYARIFADREVPRALSTVLAVDACNDESDLVDELIDGWCEQDNILDQAWSEESGAAAGKRPKRRLRKFARLAREECGKRLFAFLTAFDRLFEHMTGALLATMRDLEHEGTLVVVNVSPYQYRELYHRRARRDPGFVSDYGQTHVELQLGPLTEQEARESWVEVTGATLDDRRERAFFAVAYEESGGLGTPFEIAASRYDPGLYTDDIRPWRRALRELLEPRFARLLDFDVDEHNDSYVLHLAHEHLGVAQKQTRIYLEQHAWAPMLVGNGPGLRCEVLGRAAVKRLGGSAGRALGAVALYEKREFTAARTAADRSGSGCPETVACAATICSLVFGESPHGLYFHPVLDWGLVARLAERGAAAAVSARQRQDFDAWGRVARSMARAPRDRGSQGQAVEAIAAGNVETLEDLLVHDGVRLLAVRRDRSPTTAAHVAIPIVEDLLRIYVAAVGRTADAGMLLRRTDPAGIDRVWSGLRPFRVPPPGAACGGVELAIAAALLSAESDAPLFADPSEFHMVLDKLERHRNLLAHHVVSPRSRAASELTELGEKLLEGTAAARGLDLTLESIERMVRPPRLE